MKFDIPRDKIHEAIQRVASVVPQRSTIAMTQNILMTARENRVTLAATDLEITIYSWTQAEVLEEGSLAVPGKLISDIIRELPNIQLTFESDEDYRLRFHSEFGEYKISGENPAEFPQKPQIDDITEISLPNDRLKKLIEKTIFACSTDELRPALTGVYFELGERKIRTVATDGHRLAIMQYAAKDLPEENISAIISTRALNFVLRNLDTEGLTVIKLGDKHTQFQMDNTELFARLIDEVYVDYNKVIPQGINFEMLVQNSEFYASVKRVSLFSNPITSQVILRVNPDALELTAEDVDYGGEAKERISCEFNGQDFIIGFNSRYLQDLLRHIDTDRVMMQFIRPDYAVLARPVDAPENEEQLMLLMPVRLDES